MADEIDILMARRLLPFRPVDGHKGTFGHVFILGGSRRFCGAPRMACDAAARSGAGLVTAGVPDALANVIGAGLVEPMCLPLPSTALESLSADALEPALAFAADKAAVVLGPGLGTEGEAWQFVRDFVRKCPVPTVVDADGLNALAADCDALRGAAGPLVLTPHPGEMARLTGSATTKIQAHREPMAGDFARQYRCVLVLKGHRTVVAGPEGRILVNTTGNAGMATGGAGDVLSGLIGGLLAQGMAPFDAAALGVFVHGLAGDLAAEEKTQRGMVASDLIAALPASWRLLERTEKS